MSIYNDAVLVIAEVAKQEPAIALRDLVALKAMIDLMIAKLPPEKADYEADKSD